ncbi:glutaminyl-peptide cyclotransferase [Chloroflexota bacterium]
MSTSLCSCISDNRGSELTPSDNISQSAPVYTYRVVNTYPHDRDAFTQGLVFDNGVLYEGTGLKGSSSIRKVDLETGEVLQIYKLPADYFGEGITIYKGMIIQLTWKSGTGFIYDRDSFELLREFPYSTEGWGITYDGDHLIMSDGSAVLYFLDPETLNTVDSIEVRDKNTLINRINELEYINGKIYANLWKTDKIAIIDPDKGSVTGWIDLNGLLNTQHYNGTADVLNGIAYDEENKRLFVTGKLWPFLFEIELIEE